MFFSLILPLGIRQLRRKGPSIIIDARGIEDVRWKIGPFLWTDITAVWIVNLHGTKSLCLAVRDPGAYISRLSGWKQKAAPAQQASGIPFSLGFSGLKPDITEAVAYIRANWSEKFRVPGHS